MADLNFTQTSEPVQRFCEVPEADRERLGFGVPHRFEVLDLAQGRRELPSWAWGARINWRWGFSNRPDYLLRCRHDPLGFAKGAVWRMSLYDDAPYDAGAKRMARRSTGRRWMAEHEGVASCHYHSGTIRMTEFEDTVADEKGHVVWIEKPDYKAGKQGVPQTRKYTMLATDPQEGYAGRAFEITLAAQEIPIWDSELRREVITPVVAGTKLKLRGPWHGSAPEGYREVSYQFDREPYATPKRKGWHRKWHERVGYFGLCIRPSVLLDIMATYQPHIEWALMTFDHKGEDQVGVEPLHSETGLPKGWRLDQANCTHDFMLSNYATNRRPQPSDDCRWCGVKRDPDWRPRDHNGNVYAWWEKRVENLTFKPYSAQVTS